jgi:hypothetical protein
VDNLFDLVGDVGIGNGVLVHHGRFYSHPALARAGICGDTVDWWPPSSVSATLYKVAKGPLEFSSRSPGHLS